MKYLFDMVDCYDRRCETPASVRNAIGYLAEEFACRVLDLERLPVDGRKSICPDAVGPEGYFEIKSIGKNNRALIYKFRLEKEEQSFGPNYRYVFVRHECPVSQASASQVAEHFRNLPPVITVTTLASILEVIGDTEPRKFKIFEEAVFDRKAMRGSCREGYVEGGWQFSLNKIKWSQAIFVPIQWKGETIKVEVRC